MAGETIITVIGNLVSDPELKFLPSGSAVANFTIASTPRSFNKQSNEWEDGETLFLRSSIWREAAENVATSLTKGMRVIAQGALKQRSYETREGEKRTSYELEVHEIGPSLKYATAKVTKAQRNGNGTSATQSQQSAPQQWGQAPAQSDPWQGAPSAQQGAWPSEPGGPAPF